MNFYNGVVFKRLQNHLKEVVYNLACMEIIKLCTIAYDIRCADGNHTCSLEDGITVIRTSSWYYGNMSKSRQVIHMLAYCIFRSGLNQWALNA